MGKVTNFDTFFTRVNAIKRKAQTLNYHEDNQDLEDNNEEDASLDEARVKTQNDKKLDHIVECSDVLEILSAGSECDVYFAPPRSKPSEERIKLIGKRRLKSSDSNIVKPFRPHAEILPSASTPKDSFPLSSSPTECTSSQTSLLELSPPSLGLKTSKSLAHFLSASKSAKKFKRTGSTLKINNQRHQQSLDKTCSTEKDRPENPLKSDRRVHFASHIDKDGFKIPLLPCFSRTFHPNNISLFSRPQHKPLKDTKGNSSNQKRESQPGSIDAYIILPSDESDGIQIVEVGNKTYEEGIEENSVLSNFHRENISKALSHRKALKLLHCYKYFKRKKPKIKKIPLDISLKCNCLICKEMKILLKKFNDHQLSAYGMRSFCFKSIEDALSLYLCQSDGAENYYYNKKCIYGYCKKCRYKKMKRHFLKMEKSYSYKPLSFEKFFENFKGNLKMLCRDIKVLAKHYYVLKWQCFQFWQIQQNLPANSAIVMCCCSVKLRLKEVESKLPLAMLYPFIVYYNHPENNQILSEEICFFVPGSLKLDAQVLGHFIAAIGRHLEQKRHLDISLQIQFVCGCNEFYESPMVLLDFAASPHKIKCPVIRNYFDEAIGHILEDVRKKIKKFWHCFTKNLTNKEISYLLQCKKYKKEKLGSHIYNLMIPSYIKLGGGSTLFYYGTSSSPLPPKKDLVAEDMLPFFTQVKSGKSNEIIFYRKLICLCQYCRNIQNLESGINGCENKQYVKPFKAFSLIRRKKKKSNNKEMKEHSTPNPKKMKPISKEPQKSSPLKKKLKVDNILKREAFKNDRKKEINSKVLPNSSPKKSVKMMIKPSRDDKKQILDSDPSSPLPQNKNKKNNVVKGKTVEEKTSTNSEVQSTIQQKKRGRPKLSQKAKIYEFRPPFNIFEQPLDSSEVVQIGAKLLRRKGRDQNSQTKPSRAESILEADTSKEKNQSSTSKKKGEMLNDPTLSKYASSNEDTNAHKNVNNESDPHHCDITKGSDRDSIQSDTTSVAQMASLSSVGEKHPEDPLPLLLRCNASSIVPDNDFSQQLNEGRLDQPTESATLGHEKQLPDLDCFSPSNCLASREATSSRSPEETLPEIHLSGDLEDRPVSHESDPGYESSPPPLQEGASNEVSHSLTTILVTFASNDNLLLENIPVSVEESSKDEPHTQTNAKDSTLQGLPDASFEHSSSDASDNTGYISDPSTPTQGLPSSTSDSSGASQIETFTQDSEEKSLRPDLSSLPSQEDLESSSDPLNKDNFQAIPPVSCFDSSKCEGSPQNKQDPEFLLKVTDEMVLNIELSLGPNSSPDDVASKDNVEHPANDSSVKVVEKIVDTNLKTNDKEKPAAPNSEAGHQSPSRSLPSKPTAKKSKRKAKPSSKPIKKENGLSKEVLNDMQESTLSSSQSLSLDKDKDGKDVQDSFASSSRVPLQDKKEEGDKEKDGQNLEDSLSDEEDFLSLKAGKTSKSKEILRKRSKKYLDKCIALVKGAKWVPGLVKEVGEHNLRVIFFQKSGQYLVPQSWNEVMPSHKTQKGNEVGWEFVLGLIDPPKCIDNFGHALLTEETVRKGNFLFERWCRAHPQFLKANEAKSPAKDPVQNSSSHTRKKRTATSQSSKSNKRTCRR